MKDITYDFQLKTDMHRKKLSGVPVFLSLRTKPRHGSQRIHKACLVTYFLLFCCPVQLLHTFPWKMPSLDFTCLVVLSPPLLKPTLPMSKQTRNFPIKVLSPTDAQENCFKTGIKIYIRTAPTCFGVITIIRERTIRAC